MSLLLPLLGGTISNLTLPPVPPQLRWTTRFNGLFKAESATQHVDVECGDHFTEDKRERERSWMRDNNCTDVEKVAMFCHDLKYIEVTDSLNGIFVPWA